MNADTLIGLPEAVKALNDPSITVSKLLSAIQEGRLTAVDDENRPGRKLVTLEAIRAMQEADSLPVTNKPEEEAPAYQSTEPRVVKKKLKRFRS